MVTLWALKGWAAMGAITIASQIPGWTMMALFCLGIVRVERYRGLTTASIRS